MDDIKVGEYVRIKGGYIRKIEIINKDIAKTVFGKYGLDVPYKNSWSVAENKIVKHSLDLIDLIDVGDIVETETSCGLENNGILNWITNIGSQEVIKNMRNNKDVKVLSILTHEQFNSMKYIVRR